MRAARASSFSAFFWACSISCLAFAILAARAFLSDRSCKLLALRRSVCAGGFLGFSSLKSCVCSVPRVAQMCVPFFFAYQVVSV